MVELNSKVSAKILYSVCLTIHIVTSGNHKYMIDVKHINTLYKSIAISN